MANPDRQELNKLIDAGNLESFRDYVERHQCHKTDLGSGKTLLHWCAEADQVTMVRYLASKGANLDAESEGGVTPLMCAIHSNSVGAVEELLRLGASFSRGEELEFSAVDYASGLKRERILSLLRSIATMERR